MGRDVIRHRRLAANGIGHHVAEAGGRDRPAVLLLHGFPELGYSWRHQLPALAAAGYRAIAPDLRGYGRTDAPLAVEAYAMKELLADALGVLDALDIERAVVVGHDWGANSGWALAELHPDRVVGLVALSVPYRPRPVVPPTQLLRDFSGASFNFPLAVQRGDVAEAELEADVAASLRRFLFALSGDAPEGTIDTLYREKPAGAGILDGMPDPVTLPPWLTETELDTYVRAFERTGFRGALNRYRNLDRDWRDLPTLGTAGPTCPVLFVAGERDPALVYGDLEPMRALPSQVDTVLLPGCGHWTQQERPARTNGAVLDFLRSRHPPAAPRSTAPLTPGVTID